MVESSDEGPGLARIDFSEGDEAQLHRLAWAMGIVGLLQTVFAGIGLLFALFFITQMMKVISAAPMTGLLLVVWALMSAALPLYQGIVLREAGEYFGKVASTDDDDQAHLASAFRRLRVVFILEAVLVLPLAWKLI